MVTTTDGWQKIEERTPPKSDRIGTRTLAGGQKEILFDAPASLFERSLAGNEGGLGSFRGAKIVQVGIQLQAGHVKEPFASNPWVHAAIKAFSGGFIQLRTKILDRDPSEEGATEIRVPDIMRLLGQPNAAMIDEELMECLASEYKLLGEVVWFILGANGPIKTDASGLWLEWPKQIIPAKKTLVELLQDPATGMPALYRYRTSAKAKKKNGKDQGYSAEYLPAQVIQFRDYNPSNMLRGLGDAEVAAYEVDLYNTCSRYLDASVKAGGNPGGMVIYEERLMPYELEARQDVLEDELGGDEGLRYKILDGGAKFIANPVTPKDLEYRTLLEWLRDTTLSVIGVPGPVVGVYGDATMNNVDTAHVEMWRGPNGVLRLGTKSGKVLTQRMLRRCAGLDPRLLTAHLIFDHSHVERLREDRTEQIKVAADVASKGVGASMNSALTAMGVGVQVEGGDAVLPLGGARAAAQGGTTPPKEQKARAAQQREEIILPAKTPPPRATGGHDGIRSVALSWLEDYTAAIRTHIRTVVDGKQEQANRLSSARGLDDALKPEDMTEADWRLLLLDDAEWIERLAAELDIPLADVFETAMAAARADLPGAPILTVSHPRVFREIAGQKILLSEGVTSRAAQQVKNAILDALAAPGGDPGDGLSMRQRIKAVLPELDEKLERVFGTKESRAATIAQTETGKAEMSGKYAQWAESGVTEIQWFTSQDGEVRLTHKALHGERVPLGAPFTNGLRYPLDNRGNVEQVVNCFPGSAVVEGSFTAGLKANYAGPLIEIVTIKGRRLSVTPNHPVLTTDGWVSAGKLKKGMSCIGYERQVRSGLLGDVDQEHGPTSIEEAFHAIGSVGARRLGVIGCLDLYRDAASMDSEVEIVDIDGGLGADGPPHELQGELHLPLELADRSVSPQGSVQQLSLRDGLTSPALPGSGALTLDCNPPASLDLLPLEALCFGSASQLSASASQFARDNRTADPNFLRELQDAAPGLVAADEVIDVRERDFVGHVFDVEAVGGWLIADGLVCSNCRCSAVPTKRIAPPEEDDDDQ